MKKTYCDLCGGIILLEDHKDGQPPGASFTEEVTITEGGTTFHVTLALSIQRYNKHNYRKAGGPKAAPPDLHASCLCKVVELAVREALHKARVRCPIDTENLGITKEDTR